MRGFVRFGCLAAAIFLNLTASGRAQSLPGEVPAIIKERHLEPVGRLPANTNLNLAIGLLLRNRAALSNLLEQIYDPASTNFHHYLNSEQFTRQFGPTDSDYEAVKEFARTNGLTVTQTYSNRQLLDVTGSVANIEKAFHIKLFVYRHPTEPREFFAPDVEPSVDATLPILSVSGLSDYTRPRPLHHTTSQTRSSIRS